MRTLVLVALFAAACTGADPAPEKAGGAAPPVQDGAPGPVAGDASAAAETTAAAGTIPQAPGKAIYDQYCVACHQADGRGMNGTLAASFIDDPARLAKSDDALLRSIAEGLTGTVGTMPAWKGTLSDTQMKDALAYVRATYAGD